MTHQYFEVRIEKFVHGGQGIGLLETGQKVFIWGALPGEKVTFRVTKKRSDYLEGMATNILEPSHERIAPKDEAYLSTSPWQILSEKVEDTYKTAILSETIKRAGVMYEQAITFCPTIDFWHYRNKMEYSFYGDENGLHLALYNRGTHHKNVVSGSSIARSELDLIAAKILEVLQQNQVRASDLKTLILRVNLAGEVVAAIFTKNKIFPKLDDFATLCKGIVVVYSNPKSPASVRTKDIYSFGDITLLETIGNKHILYDVFSFFQVNIPVFESALEDISTAVKDFPLIDMYSGVGSIGVSLPSAKILVESDEANIFWANKNAEENPNLKVIHAKSEQALDYIDDKHVVVVDPPRAGLHGDVVETLLQVKPPKIVYLSCNPSTQARDMALLQEKYKVELIKGYNFFPRTPHIESLAVLVRH